MWCPMHSASHQLQAWHFTHPWVCVMFGASSEGVPTPQLQVATTQSLRQYLYLKAAPHCLGKPTSSHGWKTHRFLVVCIYRNHWLQNSTGKSCHLPQVLQRHPVYSQTDQTLKFGQHFRIFNKGIHNRPVSHQQYTGTLHSESIDLFSAVMLLITLKIKELKFFTKIYISRIKPFLV